MLPEIALLDDAESIVRPGTSATPLSRAAAVRAEISGGQGDQERLADNGEVAAGETDSTDARRLVFVWRRMWTSCP